MNANSSDKQLLKELKNRLEQRADIQKKYEELQQEYQAMSKRLKDSEALKSHFISNVTNEIVNPFTSIIGLSKAILSVDKQEWKKIVSMVALIHNEAFNLDFQLKNIFTAAKIEAGEILPNVQKVHIRQLIQSVIDSFTVVTRKMGIEIEFDYEIQLGFGEKDYYFNTDAEKLKQIISNILNNAVKYSYKDSKVIVKTWIDDDLLFIRTLALASRRRTRTSSSNASSVWTLASTPSTKVTAWVSPLPKLCSMFWRALSTSRVLRAKARPSQSPSQGSKLSTPTLLVATMAACSSKPMATTM